MKPSDAPGPGYYQPKLVSTSRSVSFGARPRQLRSADAPPPPGKYDPVLKPQGPKYSFGRRTRSLSADTSIPAPTHYNPNLPSSSRSISFGARPRHLSGTESHPGPGSYDPKESPVTSPLSTRGNAPAVSFGSRPRDFSRSQMPAPGESPLFYLVASSSPCVKANTIQSCQLLDHRYRWPDDFDRYATVTTTWDPAPTIRACPKLDPNFR